MNKRNIFLILFCASLYSVNFTDIWKSILNIWPDARTIEHKNVSYVTDFNEQIKQELEGTDRLRAVEVAQRKIGRNANARPLKIGVSVSGGGYRAMFGALGFLKGLQTYGILDSILYVSALSGSTWGLSRWIQGEEKLADTIQKLAQKVSHNKEVAGIYMLPQLSNDSFKQYLENLRLKYVSDQPLSHIVELYGSMVSENIFEKSKLKNRLSEEKILLKSGSYPLPIYNSVVIPNRLGRGFFNKLHINLNSPHLKLSSLPWVEYTPWHIGLHNYNAYVKTEMFDALYQDKRSIADSVEPSLAFLMGVFGSAFSGSINYALKDFPELVKINIIFAALVKEILESNQYTNARLVVAQVNNFMKGMNNEFGSDKLLKVADAGLETNLPIIPLLPRNVDLILSIDFSPFDETTRELFGAASYAHDHGLPFPKFNKERVEKEIESIKNGSQKQPFIILEESGKPTIIHFPFVLGLTEDFNIVSFGFREEKINNLLLYYDNLVNNSRETIQGYISSLNN